MSGTPETTEKDILLQMLVEDIQKSRKYRQVQVPVETLRDLLTQEYLPQRSRKQILKAVREKLHNIVAPYLGDPDYDQVSKELAQAFTAGSESAVQAFCLQLMKQHASTQERLPYLDVIYPEIWSVTGTPTAILDLACGLHPFSLPWMSLNRNAAYYAYDIHLPRINLINQFITLYQQQGIGFHDDILINPPKITADVAFFLKEAHRLEQRQSNSNLPMWQSLNAKWLIVSLPAVSLHGSRSLAARQCGLISHILNHKSWPVTELKFGPELFFIIQKNEP